MPCGCVSLSEEAPGVQEGVVAEAGGVMAPLESPLLSRGRYPP